MRIMFNTTELTLLVPISDFKSENRISEMLNTKASAAYIEQFVFQPVPPI